LLISGAPLKAAHLCDNHIQDGGGEPKEVERLQGQFRVTAFIGASSEEFVGTEGLRVEVD